MLGLTVLFFLGLWVIITIVAMVIGSKFGRKPATKVLGAFLGFMLTMGGFIAHWTIEYIQIQRAVTHLCETEAGIKVYVTPEEWRQQIGEAEWDKLYLYSWEEQSSYPKQNMIVNNEEFRPSAMLNPRIVIYAKTNKLKQYIIIHRKLFYDVESNKLLFSINTVSTITQGLALGGYKSWLNHIGCDNKTINKQKTILLNKYFNKGEGDE